MPQTQWDQPPRQDKKSQKQTKPSSWIQGEHQIAKQWLRQTSLWWSNRTLTCVYQYHKSTQPCKNVGDVEKKVTARRNVTNRFRASSAKSTHTQQRPARSTPVSYETAREHQVKEQVLYKQMYGHRDQGGKDHGTQPTAIHVSSHQWFHKWYGHQ